MEPQTEKRRHSASHVLAQAVIRLFPDAKLGIGPVTDEGFYYDFQFSKQLHGRTWNAYRKK
jgi:threonyl-tRNA synthetase